jgi:hypothetical protein
VTATITKPAAAPKKKNEAAHVALHELYVAYVSDDAPVDGEGRVKLRELARRFGVPFAEADYRAARGCWELERQWLLARRWYLEHGLGARTEEEFCTLFAAKEYGHLIAQGKEGARLAEAHAVDLWRSIMSDAFTWEAHEELRLAKEAYDAVQEAHKAIEYARRTAPPGPRRIFELGVRRC